MLKWLLFWWKGSNTYVIEKYFQSMMVVMEGNVDQFNLSVALKCAVENATELADIGRWEYWEKKVAERGYQPWSIYDLAAYFRRWGRGADFPKLEKVSGEEKPRLYAADYSKEVLCAEK